MLSADECLAGVRGDGSSKFGDGNRWGVFPSAALAWRISDEAFMANTKDWLSALKLRLSFGTAGNNRINSGLLYTTYSLSGNDSRNPFFNGTSTPMLEHGTYLYNPKLKWEKNIVLFSVKGCHLMNWNLILTVSKMNLVTV